MKKKWIIWIIILIVVITLAIVLMRTGVTGNLVFKSSANEVCADSDNGANSFVKGITSITINGAVVSKIDVCSGKSHVIEYSCERNMFSTNGFIEEKRIECESICNEGACAVP